MYILITNLLAYPGHDFAVERFGALGHYNDGEAFAIVDTAPEFGYHLIDVVRDFRDKRYVGSAGHSGRQRNPACVASHDFQNHDAVMAGGGGDQLVHCFGGDLYGRLKTKCKIRAG